MENKRRLRKWILPIGIAAIVLILLNAVGLIWFNGIFDRYVRLPGHDDLSGFADLQNGRELIGVFSSPDEIENAVGTTISRELWESEFVSYLERGENSRQTNYLFKVGEDHYVAVSLIQFQDEETGAVLCDAMGSGSFGRANYVSRKGVRVEGEPSIDFNFFGGFLYKNKGYAAHESGVSYGSGRAKKGLWYEGTRAVQLVAESEDYEEIRQELIRYFKED